jgi:hypothetical protein
MTSQNLFVPVCGTFLLIMILIAAILGMQSRIHYANQLFQAYKKNQAPEDRPAKHFKRQKVLLMIALFCVLGILFLPIMIFMGILTPSSIVLAILIILIVTCIVCGVLLEINSRKLLG